jgi:hypothetical protein
MEVTRKAGNVTRGLAERFTGDVWMWPRIGATEHTEVRAVLFTPGARRTVQHSPERVPNFTLIVRLFFSLGNSSVRTVAGIVPLCQSHRFYLWPPR